MKKKEFVHNKNEKCKLTQEQINTGSAKYAIVLDCDGDEIESIGFYKREEFKDFMKGNVDKVTKKTMERTQKLAGGMLGGMLNKMGLSKDIYEVKNETTESDK